MSSIITHGGKALLSPSGKTINFDALIDQANETTGASDVTLTDAIQTLCDGYGQGGGTHDMSVTDNQVKYLVYVTDVHKTIATRFAGVNGATVVVDWGDGSSDNYTATNNFEYASQKQHSYSNAGEYVISLTCNQSGLIIGTINGYFKGLELILDDVYMNHQYVPCILNNIIEIAFGDNVIVNDNGITNVPCVKLNRFCLANATAAIRLQGTSVRGGIEIPEGVTKIGSYCYTNTKADYFKIPSSLVEISNNAFDSANCSLYDFTDIQLVGGEFPIILSATNVFRNIQGKRILFANQEIANAAKQATNWAAWADNITYVGEAV